MHITGRIKVCIEIYFHLINAEIPFFIGRYLPLYGSIDSSGLYIYSQQHVLLCSLFGFVLVFFHLVVLANLFDHYISILFKIFLLFSLKVMAISPRGESATFSDGSAKAIRG